MAVGFRVRNQGSGQIQIGIGYKNLQLVKSGTLNTGTFIGSSTSGTPPLAALTARGFLASTNGTTNLHVCRYINDSVSTSTGFSLVQSGLAAYVFASSNAPSKTFEYYTFNASTQQGSGPVGLRLREESGSVFYDSRRKGIRVLDTISLPTSPIQPVQLGQYFVGTKIGIAIPSPRFYYASVSQDRCTMSADFFHMTSDNRIFLSRNTVSEQILLTNTFPIGSATVSPQSAYIFIVDLSEIPMDFTA